MPEHPYTKLLEVIDGAHFVRFEREHELILAWLSAGRVEVLNKEGACIDFFGVPESATVQDVEAEVDRYIRTELPELYADR